MKLFFTLINTSTGTDEIFSKMLLLDLKFKYTAI